MEEDEEVVFENSVVHHHLKDSGFFDVETKTIGKTFNYKADECSKPVTKNKIIENQNVIEEISTIKSANLLFEDDINHIDNVLANIEINKNEQLKYVFMGSACALVLAVGLCFYFVIGYYAVFLISIYYTYRASDYLWKKHKRLKMLKTLINNMKCNFFLLNNVLKFLQENENILKSRLSLKESNIAVQKLYKLKNNVIQHERKINNIVANFTSFLLNKLPLLEYVDDDDNYICKSIEPIQDSESISQLYNIYMLLQSQFLTRLTFSIVPSLVQNPDDSYLIVHKAMYKLSSHLKELNTSLDYKFKQIMCNGMYSDQNISACALPRPKPDRNPSVENLVRNVHDLSNSLQYSLIKARELEINLESEADANTEKELEEIQSELSLCLSHVSDLLILHNHSRAVFKYQKHENRDVDQTEFARITELGYSDLDPNVDDDLFEAIINDTPDVQEVLLHDDEEVIDPLAKKKRKLMLSELKSRLKDKAEEWSQRESAVRARKGLPIENELPIVKDDSSDSSECEMPRPKKTYREKYGDSSSDEEFDKKPNIEFQQALLEMKKNLFLHTEEFICDTTEDD